MTRLTLIAHAETAATRRAAFAGDEALCPQGWEAAQGSARPRADAAWRSPALAARDTAEALGLAAAAEPALRDLDAGRWAGLAFAAVAAGEPDAAGAFLGDPAFAGHGGESVEELLRRIAGWLDGLRGERGRLVAVTHAAVIRAAVLTVLGAPASAFWRMDVAPLEQVALSGDGRRWSLRAQPLHLR